MKVNYLAPLELEIEYDNSVEIDWTSLPIYDEYLNGEVFDKKKQLKFS